jgi:hypothetical protein
LTKGTIVAPIREDAAQIPMLELREAVGKISLKLL